VSARDPSPADGPALSAAVIIWAGFGQTSWPQRDEPRLVKRLGPDAAAELLPRIWQLEDDFYGTGAVFKAPDQVTMGNMAADDFRRKHPEISEKPVEALSWCDTWDYK